MIESVQDLPCRSPTAREGLSEVSGETLYERSRSQGNPRSSGHQTQHRLTPSEVDRLLASYRRGLSVTEIAGLYRIHRTTVTAHLRKKHAVDRWREQAPAVPCSSDRAERRVNRGDVDRQVTDMRNHHVCGVRLERVHRPFERQRHRHEGDSVNEADSRRRPPTREMPCEPPTPVAAPSLGGLSGL